ncbi:MAG TPA: hypothetical protein VGM43_18245 [Bryobacteraceae bacterium]|jgi:hypothetical protein
MLDHHTVALISIVGSSLDVLGALYLAYDLLGGEHGPLRTLTRAMTYGVLFGIGFGLALGPVFGLVTGIAHGVTLGWEYSWASQGCRDRSFRRDTTMSAIRGASFAIGTAYLFGPRFGIIFGTVSTIAQAAAYRLDIRPARFYDPQKRIGFNRFILFAAVNRTIGYGVAAYLTSLVAGHRAQALSIGLSAGLAIGLVTAFTGPATPLIEWVANNVPAKRMGVAGIGIVLVGFALQSVQYWLAFLDIKVQ